MIGALHCVIAACVYSLPNSTITLSRDADIDECTAGTSNCHAYADCSNTLGSFTCTCTSEFEGDGVNTCDCELTPLC